MRSLVIALVAFSFLGCGPKRYRMVSPLEARPSGQAEKMRYVLLSTRPDGSKDYALVLAREDEALTALFEFARREGVIAARFSGLGAVKEAQFGWFDLKRKQYRSMHTSGQVEVLSLIGDIGIDGPRNPVIHGHLVLGDKNGHAFGGHLISAVASPTLEIFLTTFPTPLTKRKDVETDLQFFDLPRR